MNKKMAFLLDTGLGVFVAKQDGKYCVPVLEYDKIGQGGNFNTPYTFTLELCESLGTSERMYMKVKESKIPESIKKIFKMAFSGEKIEGMPRMKIGVA